MNNTGTGRDIVLIVFLVVTVAIIYFLSNFIGTTIVNEVKNNPGMNDPLYVNQFNATAKIEETINVGNTLYDKVIFGFIGLCLALFVTSYLVGGQPIYQIFYFIFLIIAVITSILFANVYQEIVTNTYYDFGQTWESFPLTNNLVHYLPIYIVAIGIVGMIIMFARPREERNQ